MSRKKTARFWRIEMANDAPQEEQQQGGWLRSLLNAVLIYFAVNTVMSIIAGKFGPQKNVTNPDGTISHPVNQIPALWTLGTDMVRLLNMV
jgi:hypothetical protein